MKKLSKNNIISILCIFILSIVFIIALIMAKNDETHPLIEIKYTKDVDESLEDDEIPDLDLIVSNWAQWNILDYNKDLKLRKLGRGKDAILPGDIVDDKEDIKCYTYNIEIYKDGDDSNWTKDNTGYYIIYISKRNPSVGIFVFKRIPSITI